LYYDYKEEESVDPPSFISSPMNITINEESMLRLPCKLDNLQGSILLWKKENTIIAIGTLVVDMVGFSRF
jgi:hypothetical protein